MDYSVVVDVDILCRGNFRKSRHRHYISCKDYDKSCAGGYLYVLYCDCKVFGRSEFFRIIGKAVLRFCYAYGEICKTELCELVDLFLCGGKYGYCISAVNFLYNGENLFLYRCIEIICKAEIVFFFAELYDFFCKLYAALAAVSVICPTF